MSTDKLHYKDAQPGHDAESSTIKKWGLSELVQKAGRTEECVDTVSMYKKASEGSLMGGIAGGSLGAVLGAETAGAFTDSATTKLLAAIAGGVGGAYAGKHFGNRMDTSYDNDLNWGVNRKRNMSIASGILGGSIGYATNKYVLGNKKPASLAISTLLGAGIGAGIGHILSNENAQKFNTLSGGDHFVVNRGPLNNRFTVAENFARFIVDNKDKFPNLNAKLKYTISNTSNIPEFELDNDNAISFTGAEAYTDEIKKASEAFNEYIKQTTSK